MPTVSRRLPAHPHLSVPKQQARDLLRQCREGSETALDRVRRQQNRFKDSASEILPGKLKLSHAQFVIAREYGFDSWTQLKERITGNTPTHLIDKAIRSNDTTAVTGLLTAFPNLLHVPVVSGNWGPPLSHAANMGRLEMVKVIAGFGAKDFQYAFERALLHGDLEIAEWLHGQGAELKPGVIMGSCETLNDRGFAFLMSSGASITDEKGNRLAPLASVLETYSRYPTGKHEILRLLKTKGYDWEDSPVMAFHCGDLERLKIHLNQDPDLINRRFSYREIYPPALGCADDGRSGLHGTPIDGTTLLHMSIDFDEKEIFDWLLTVEADVNAPANIDSEGFGGHTPLFNAIVCQSYSCGRQRDAYMFKRLLELGADPGKKVNLRKYLDWREEPGWHIARNVNPLDWAEDFPERSWVNEMAVNMISAGPFH